MDSAIPDAAILSDAATGAPGGLMCAWLNVNAADRAEFREYHDREHMFERLSVPGFNRGRRFGAIEASSDFLMVYEVDDLATLASDAYLARLNAPTPWTLRSIAKVTGTRRASLRVVYSRGGARGGFVLSLRCAARDDEAWNDGLHRLGDQLARHRGIVAFHAGRSDELISNLETAERNTGSRTATWAQQPGEQILIVEASSADDLRDLLHDQLSEQRIVDYGVQRRIDAGIYGLQICVEALARDV